MNKPDANFRQVVDRRTVLRFLAVASGAGLLAACQPASPTSTTSSAAPTAVPAKPTTAPAGAAPTTAPPAPAAAPTTAAAPQAKSGGTLTVGMNQDVLTLDIPNYRSTQDILIGGLIMDGLVSYDKDAKLRPGLAESWKQVDATTYEFVIRQGVKFTDGTPADGNAIAQHFERAKTQLKAQRFYNMIDSSTVTGNTLTFKLKQAYTPFIGNLAFGTGVIQSPASIAKYGEDIVRNPVGTGPYKLTNWTAGQSLTLERNTDYWGPAPKPDKLVLRYIQDDGTRMSSLEAGEIDVIQNPPPSRVKALKDDAKMPLISGPYAQVMWVGFNASNQNLSDARIRKAVGMVIDRAGIVNGVVEGAERPATGFLPPELSPQAAKAIAGDVAAAKKLLADAGKPNGFSIDIWTPNGTYLGDKEMAQAIQPMLKSIGIDSQVKVMDYAAYADGMARHEAGMFVLGWAHTTAPDSFFRGVFQSKSTSNWSAYANPQVDELVDKAVAQPTYDDAMKIWQQLDQILVDDGAGIPIYWSNLLYSARARVHGFSPTPFGQWDIAGLWVE